jgi:hypothetical protein
MSSLARNLFNLNTSAMANISATIYGPAKLLEQGSEEENYYRTAHLQSNGFEGVPFISGPGRTDPEPSENVRVVLVNIKSVRIAAVDAGVSDWEIVEDHDGPGDAASGPPA